MEYSDVWNMRSPVDIWRFLYKKNPAWRYFQQIAFAFPHRKPSTYKAFSAYTNSGRIGFHNSRNSNPKVMDAVKAWGEVDENLIGKLGCRGRCCSSDTWYTPRCRKRNRTLVRGTKIIHPNQIILFAFVYTYWLWKKPKVSNMWENAWEKLRFELDNIHCHLLNMEWFLFVVGRKPHQKAGKPDILVKWRTNFWKKQRIYLFHLFHLSCLGCLASFLRNRWCQTTGSQQSTAESRRGCPKSRSQAFPAGRNREEDSPNRSEGHAMVVKL